MPEHVEDSSCICWGCISLKTEGAFTVQERAVYRRLQVWRLRDQLLEATHDIAHLPEGPRVVKTEALLDLLEQAVKPSGEIGSGGGGGASGPGLPLDAAALDLMVKIQQESNDQYWLRYPGKSAPSLEDKIRGWVDGLSDKAEDQEAVADCHRVLASWVNEIESLLNPPIIVALRRPCPACHSDEVREELNGEKVVNRAVVATISRDQSSAVVVRCRVCKAEWAGRDIHTLEELTRSTE